MAINILLTAPPLKVGDTDVQGGTDGFLLSISGGKLSEIDPSSLGGGNPAGNIGEIQFNLDDIDFGADSNLFWDNVGKRLSIGGNPDTDTRMTIKGESTDSSTFAVKIHNSTGTNNSLVVRNDGFVGVNTDIPPTNAVLGATQNLLGIQIGSTINDGFRVTERGIGLRRDINGTTWHDLQNQNNSSSSAVIIRLSNNITQSSALIGKTGNSYTPNQLGGEPQSLVFFNKASNNNRIKHSILSTDAISNSYFDWLAGSTGGGALPSDNSASGMDLTASIMRLVGNGNLLIGTTTDVASSILTIQSTEKGVLIPRMTDTQRDAIVSPAEGLIIYNLTTNKINFHNGSSWRAVDDSAV